MQKSGDVSSAFIREDAIESLEQMVQYASIAKVLPSLIAAGARWVSVSLRKNERKFDVFVAIFILFANIEIK